MKPIQTNLQKRTSLTLSLSNKETPQLTLTPLDQFALTPEGKNIRVKKYQNIELNLTNFDKPLLRYLLEESLKTKKPVGDILQVIITDILKDKQSTSDLLRIEMGEKPKAKYHKQT